jgi:hypothetical protein
MRLGVLGRIELALLLAVFWVQAGRVMMIGLELLDFVRLANLADRFIAGPLEVLTALSIQCYALIGVFVLGLRAAWRERCGLRFKS